VSVGALRDAHVGTVADGQDGVNEWCVAVTAGGVGGHAALGTGVKGHALTLVRTFGSDELNAPHIATGIGGFGLGSALTGNSYLVK